MCDVCAAFRPLDPDCPYEELAESGTGTGGTSAPSVVFTLDQVADQLTMGYWGGTQRSHDAGPGDTLSVDLSGLTSNAQYTARAALQSWTDVTGIRFEELSPVSLTQTSETGDAASHTGTGTSMAVNQVLRGTLNASGSDSSDWVRVTLVQGQTYTIQMDGVTLADPYLRLRDNAGQVLVENDDRNGLNSEITFTADRSGTYYIEARSYSASTGNGSYDLTLMRGQGSSADIVFDDEQSGAYASSSRSGSTITSSFINVNSGWFGGQTALDTYTMQTYIHEIGHALGLGHAGNYNGSASYGSDALYANDSWQTTVMSYFSQSQNTATNASYAFTVTPMMADIVAIQDLYGTNVQTRAGNTVYGANSNVEGYLGDIFGQMSGEDAANSQISTGRSIAFTLFDSSGTDLVDFSFSGANQRLSLVAETYSDVDGLIGNMGIARGTVIENGTTGSGNDTITGNEARNVLTGNDGNDRLYGQAGNDTLYGGNGRDLLDGGTGGDRLWTGAGSDTVLGGSGNDRMGGDSGWDRLWAGSGNDTLWGGIGNDRLGGDLGNDSLSGSTGNDTLWGGSGNDTLIGGSGADSLMGGFGHDLLTGGTGWDRFVFTGGADIVTDFQTNGTGERIDLRDIASITSFYDLRTNHLSTVDGNAVITGPAGSSLTLIGVRTTDLSADDFLF